MTPGGLACLQRRHDAGQAYDKADGAWEPNSILKSTLLIENGRPGSGRRRLRDFAMALGNDRDGAR